MNVCINKMFLSLFIIMLIFTIYSNKTFATDVSMSVDQMLESADEFLGKGEKVESVIQEKNLQDTSKLFYKAFLIVGISIALIVGICIGIKYIYEGAEGQAKLKEAFIPYIVGCLIIFSAFTIWKIVIDFGNTQGLIK